MPRPRLAIAPHLDHDAIGRRYRACRCGVEKTHWQALWLMTRPDDPPGPEQVAPLVGLSPGWVRALIHRWNAEGPDGLADRRKGASRGRSKLTTDQQIELWAALQQAPPDGGLWSGAKVAGYVRDRWGVAVCKQTGWQWLRGLGFSVQVPRPRHPGAADAEQQRRWQRRPGPTPGRAASAASGEVGRAVGRG
jgi:transposase